MEEKPAKKETRVMVGQGDGAEQNNIDKTEEGADGEEGEKAEGDEENAEEVMEEEPPPPPKPKPVPLEKFLETYDAGGIDLAFTENLEYETSPDCYPPSYYTLTGKERLLLLYAENFRKQFHNKYPDRKPLVLAIKNECGVQKFVPTTIRPTSFLFVPLIASLEGIATFVADFIEYEPLENPFTLPQRLVSPSTLIRRRYGNSFEIATLLCSMLIGAGHPAMVVSGTAKIQATTNDQRNVFYPLPVDEPIEDDQAGDDEIILSSDKYKLKPKPQLVSYLKEKLELKRINKENREREEAENKARMEREGIEDDIAFNDPYRRSHAWIVIVTNAPWTTKPRIKMLDEEGEEVDAPPTVKFIEPCTGFFHETNAREYVHIDSVWNDLNYYVNLQKCRIHEMKWDLRDTSDWEHFLAGEPPEMRVAEELSDENLGEETNKIAVEKHLDMGRTWVQKLHITEEEFDQRFPKQSKAIYYKRILHERFASHVQEDGKMERITSYADDDYTVPLMRWTWYDNRSDLMKKYIFNFETEKNEEFFLQGRQDSLKCFIYHNDHTHPKLLYFYSTPRLDSLKYAEVGGRNIILEFERIPGKCYYKEFVTKVGIGIMAALREITEKFQRDPSKPATKDIATRRFLIAQNKIHIKFHYLRGALTAVIREFIKPPKPDYGQEIIFNPSITTGYKYGGSDPEPTQLELYLLLLEQLKAEEVAKKAFDKHLDELSSIIDLRKREMHKTILKFKAFDPLRNAAALKIRMEKDEAEALEKKKRRENLPDFLAPYLVPYAGRALTYKESWSAYHACLDELKTRFVSLLNELQRRYEDLTAEAQSLKKFLNKFQNKFDDFDYERLLKESKDLELNKRMVQKRLTITHEEAQKKYDLVKQSLLKDDRLNLKSVEVLSEED